MTAPDARLLAGRYQLLEPIGRGGMGTVWRAEDTLLAREVAVKELTLPPGPREDSSVLRERVLREARTVARLHDPSIVTVFDVVEESDGRPCIVMELVPGRSLADVVAASGPLPEAAVARIGVAVLAALSVAHRAGVVHRDVKPGNVLLGEPPGYGRVWLTDFGIAATRSDPALTSTGLLIGSPAYLAPERARGATATPASDLWALGATLWTAVEGESPFAGDGAVEVLLAVAEDRRREPRRSAVLRPVLEALLEPDPARRPDEATTRLLLSEAVGPDPTRAFLTSAGGPPTALPSTVAATAPMPRPAPGPPRELGGREPTSVLPAVGAPPATGGRRGEAGPRRRRTRRRLPLVVLLAVLVLAGAVTAGVVALRRGASQASGTASSTAPAATAAVTVPADWVTRQGTGWTVRTPAAWTAVGQGDGSVKLTDPVTHTYLEITSAGGSDAEAFLRSFGRGFASGHPSYAQLSLGAAPGHPGATLSDLEFTYTDQVPLHVRDRALARGGRIYGLYFQTHADRWEAATPVFNQLMASFRVS